MKKHSLCRVSCAALLTLFIASLLPAEPPHIRKPLQIKEFRTIDGTQNNKDNPTWGSADKPFARLTAPDYADGFAEPSGADRPSARFISNAVCSQSQSIPNTHGFTDYLWQWGQFVDHDITETPTIIPTEPFNISVPTGDVWFDPESRGDRTIIMTRSYYEYFDNVREQFNILTSYMDASQVYGSDDDRAIELRTMDGTGKLKVSEGNLLPYNVNGFTNAPSGQIPRFFLAGDVRANEQLGLIAMHTLFVREHNYWAERIANGEVPMKLKRNHRGVPTTQQTMTDDEIYETARAIVAAEIQAITYREFLPVLLGPNAIPRYRGYKPTVDPTVSTEFASFAFRVGHTMLSPELLRLNADNEPIKAGNISLAASFFAPQEIPENGGIEPILRGLAVQPAQQLDEMLVDEVRNFLFGAPGSSGFDLASLNIQRGRDHGITDYNNLRVQLGLPALTSYADITQDPAKQAKIAEAYGGRLDTIDPWIGMLCEDPVPGSLVGITLQIILAEQFEALRDGDRFWYQNTFPRETQKMIEEQTLAVIIRRNTDIGDELQDNVFLLHDAKPKGPRHDGTRRGIERRR